MDNSIVGFPRALTCSFHEIERKAERCEEEKKSCIFNKVIKLCYFNAPLKKEMQT